MRKTTTQARRPEATTTTCRSEEDAVIELDLAKAKLAKTVRDLKKLIPGRVRKLEGIRKASRHAGPWAGRARRAIEQIKAGTEFTVEDLRKKVKGDPPHANAWGTVLHNAAHAGLILRKNYAQALRPDAHSRLIAIWVRL